MEKIEPRPLSFVPYLKSVIWGGEKICRYKGIPQPEPNIGESWEISAIPGHVSVVAEGTYKGESLTALIERFGAQLVGEKTLAKYGKEFPLLIKFIDAADNLSVQVHPGDDLARERHGCSGKSEMWYIIQSDEDALIYSGLTVEMTPAEYVERVKSGTFAETLAVHDARPGDIFFLPAGRVHAIGAGNFLAEIQQSSDITYRIYDYDRRDASGQTRELHTAQAKDAIDYNVSDDYKSAPASGEDSELVRCDNFVTRRILLDGTKHLPLEPGTFTIIVCLEGELEIRTQDTLICDQDALSPNQPDSSAEPTILRAGHTLLLPAVIPAVTLTGHATLLTTHP